MALFISCSPTSTTEPDPEVVFTLEPRLDQDSSGYYHLQMDPTHWQTLHRISGLITEDGEPLEFAKFNWESSHYWFIGDTLGYLVLRGLTNDLIYTSYDTVYITQFEGQEVPTINCCSYSNSDGEVNTIFAPVWSMRGDTVEVSWSNELDGFDEIEIVLD